MCPERLIKSAWRAVLLVLCVAALCQAATLSRYPYLQNVGSNHATIMWATLESGSGAVRYSTDHKSFRTVSAAIRAFLPSQTGLVLPYYQYEAELTGLPPGTDYYYYVQADGADLTEEIRFRTAGSGAPFAFLAFGDSGMNSAEQRALAQQMTREPDVGLVVHTGDIAYMHGSFQEFQSNHFDIYDSLQPNLSPNVSLMRRLPFFMCPGNHEYVAGDPVWSPTNPYPPLYPYLALHSPPKQGVPADDVGRYYSFDWGNAHFVSLDTNFTEIGEPNDPWKIRVITPLWNAIFANGGMLKWLENDLRDSRKFWRIVFMHESPYAGGQNAGDPAGKAIRDYIAPILERYDVPLVLNGHEHSYQRSKPIRNNAAVDAGAGAVYVTTGGGGAFLYEVTPPPAVGPVMEYGEKAFHYMRGEVDPYRMTLRAIRMGGSVMDTLTLAPKPRADAAVNGASFTSAMAPGGLISIFGRNLTAEENQAQSLPLPTQFPGPPARDTVSVMLNGRPIPLLYVSSTQINAQLPFDVKGANTLRVTTPNGFSDTTVNVSDVAPAIFTAVTDQGLVPAVLHVNGTPVSPSAPAKAGEFVSVYLTGLGQVNGQISAGQAAPGSPPLVTSIPVQVEIGSAPAIAPSFAGLAPGFAGLYQVNVQLPALATGTYTLKIVAAGSSSNPVTLSVASAAQ